MKAFLIILSISLVAFACSSEKEEQESNTQTSSKVVENPDEVIAYRDTIHTVYEAGEYYSFDTSTDDTLLFIKEKNYRLSIETRLDPKEQVLHEDSIPDGDVLKVFTHLGYQAYYTFSLFEGDTQVFELELTKADFKKAEYDLVLISGAYPPVFVEYNSSFDAFVFQVPFNAEGTCWASDALLLIGMDGEVKVMDRLSGSGGNSTNHGVQITKDRTKLISSSTIYYPNGESLNFVKEGSNLMGVDLFDDCLLVVYDSVNNSKNAYLKDYQGKTLLNFNYEGWTGALGYSFPYKKVKDAYYFTDETNRQLIRVKKENGKWDASQLPFSDMTMFDGNQGSNELMVELSTETKKLIFYFDTTYNEIRKLASEEY